MSYRSNFSYNTSQNSADLDRLSIGKFTLTGKGLYLGTNLLIDAGGNLSGKVVSGFSNSLPTQLPNVSQTGLFTGVRQSNPQATLDVSGTANFLGIITCASSIKCSSISAGTYLGFTSSFVGTGSSLLLQNSLGTHLTLVNPTGGGTNSFASIDFDGYNSPLPTNGAAMSLRFQDDGHYGGILSIRGKIDGAPSNSQTEQYRFAGGNLLNNNSASAGSFTQLGSLTTGINLLTYPSSSGGEMSVDSSGLLNIGQWGTTSVVIGTYLGAAATKLPTTVNVNQYGTWTASASSNYQNATSYTSGPTSNSFWVSQTTYSTVTGAYQGTVSTTFANGSVSAGEWWQTTSPYYLQGADLTFYLGYLPANYIFAASNDGVSWVNLGSGNNPIGTAMSSWSTSLTTAGNTLYSYFRIVCPKAGLSYSVLGGYTNACGIQNLALPGQPVVPLPPIQTSNAVSIRDQNVGFSNSNPQYPIDVVGFARSTGAHIIGNGLNGASPAGLIMTSTNQGNMSAPHVSVYTNNSTYPTFQQLNWQTDNICLGFDMYYDNNFRTSGTVTAYQIYKVNGQLRFNIAPSAGAGGVANNTTSMCIASNGCIGINNTNPTYQLDVTGNGRINVQGANQLTIYNSSTANSQDACEVKFDRIAGLNTAISALGVGAGGRGAYWWVNGYDRININANGQVGLNTNSPAYQLDVNGNVRFNSGGSLIGNFNFPGGSGLTWGTGPFSRMVDDGDLRICTDDNMHFYTGMNGLSSYGNERLTIAGGNVGINNTNPSYTLDVSGGIRALTSGGFFNWGGSGYHQWYRADSASGDGLCDYYSDVGGTQQNLARISCGGSWSNKTGSYNTLSDVRKKKNIRDARKYLDSLCKLRVRKYSWDDEEGSEPSQLGFIAQEVEGVMPGLVETSEWGDLKDFKTLKTTILIPMLVSAVQTLAERLAALEGSPAASAPESCPSSNPQSCC